jgi:hypothetical protein
MSFINILKEFKSKAAETAMSMKEWLNEAISYTSDAQWVKWCKEHLSSLKIFTNERFNHYNTDTQWIRWLENNKSKIQRLFQDITLRDFIFEPFKGVFTTPIKTMDANVYSVITQVAIINAVLAGLPGKMGVGVFVSMALEAWMAYTIAKHVGLEIKDPKDIAKYFGLLAGIATTILFGIKAMLGVAFSIFSVIPELNPLILAELFVTNLVGVLFFIGFTEAKRTGKFDIPRTQDMLNDIYRRTKELFDHQTNLLKGVFNMDNIRSVGKKLSVYLKGEIPVNQKEINGEVLSTAMMGYLISGHYDKLQGPLGEEFIEAIRLRWSAQFDENTTVEQIAEKFREYDSEQLIGVVNTIKGKMFEIIVKDAENIDNDKWIAKMHEDETYPGSDIILSNFNGDTLEISLKAVDESSVHIIEHALSKYPDLPIMTTDEMAEIYGDSPMVFSSGVSHEELKNITEDRLDELLNSIKPINTESVVFAGITMSTTVLLYPFVVAYLRNKITYIQLEQVFEKVLNDQGIALVSRLSYAVLFGPLFAWFLLARGVQGIVKSIEPNQKKVHYIEYM